MQSQDSRPIAADATQTLFSFVLLIALKIAGTGTIYCLLVQIVDSTSVFQTSLAYTSSIEANKPKFSPLVRLRDTSISNLRVAHALVLRPEHDTPSPTTTQGFVSSARRRTPARLGRRDAVPTESRAAVALIPVLHACKSESCVIAQPGARRGCVVAQQMDLRVVEHAVGRVLRAPPRVAEEWREGFAGDGALVELDAPSAAARERAVTRARSSALGRGVVRRSRGVARSAVALVPILDASKAIRQRRAVRYTVRGRVIGEEGRDCVLQDASRGISRAGVGKSPSARDGRRRRRMNTIDGHATFCARPIPELVGVWSAKRVRYVRALVPPCPLQHAALVKLGLCKRA